MDSSDVISEGTNPEPIKPKNERLFTRELVAVLFVKSITFFAGWLILPVLPLYMASLGISVETIGYLTSIMMVGIAISEIFWGWVIDRVDLRVAIFVGTVFLGISIAMFNYAKSLPFLALTLFVYGICRSPIFVVGRWYMSVNAPPNKKAYAMALIGTVTGVIQAIGGFASGYIAEYRGFEISFTLAAGLAFFAGVLILVLGKWLNFNKNREPHKPSAGQPKVKRTVSAYSKTITISLGFIGILYFIGMGINSTYLPLYAKEINVSISQIGNLFGIRGLISTLILLPIGRLSDKFNKWIILTVGMVIVGGALGIVGLSSYYTGLLISIIFFALGSAIYSPAIQALLSENIPVFWTGTAMGIFGFMEDVGWLIGPIIGGLLYERVSPQSPFFFAFFVTLLVIPLVAFLRRKHDTEFALQNKADALVGD